MLDFASAPEMFDSSDLAAFATLNSDAVEAAVAAVRRECGWHIAPQWQQVIKVDVSPVDCRRGPFVLMLPTLHLVSVESVKNTATNETLTAWRKSRVGYLERDMPWPVGAEAVEVTFTHGLSSAPIELKQAIVEIARSSGRDSALRSVSHDGAAFSYGDVESLAYARAIRGFKVRL